VKKATTDLTAITEEKEEDNFQSYNSLEGYYGRRGKQIKVSRFQGFIELLAPGG